MNYSFKGIGELSATFGVKDGAELAAGTPVKLGTDGLVTACAKSEGFVGFVSACRSGCAAVQLRGAAEVSCSGTGIAPGYVKLVADGSGGICSGEGREYLVLAVDNGTAAIML
ncbi:MAG: hypothetical protein ACOX81_02430 [Candidatus Heteroscillospira sp.]|jgi:hypothetical protein